MPLMEVIRSPIPLRSRVRRYKKKGEKIGFVPTMGVLHPGHVTLVRRARRECDRVLVSIFVNPLQFGPREDYSRYPRNLRSDRELLQKEKVDLLFFPSAKTMYPDLFSTSVNVGPIADRLCGRFRPGHFEGVATVCAKLFNLVSPDVVYFGQKDYQQTRVIQRVLEDLDFDIRLKVIPTVREADGLAMSSRNRYLAPEERKRALLLSEALLVGKKEILRGERRPERVLPKMRKVLHRRGIRVEYVSVVDPETLKSVSRIRGNVVLAVSAWLGRTRLIDNCLVRTR